MTSDFCGATKRDGSDEKCGLPAGWGTDHVGRGRCKLHGGMAGAPAHNQNATKHGLNADEHQYYEYLPPSEKEYVEGIAAIIRKRVERNTGDVDHHDRTRSQKVAIQLHISSRASNHIANESDTLDGKSDHNDVAPLLEDLRQYDQSISQNLEKLGVFSDPDETEDRLLNRWRSFISNESADNSA